MTPQKNDNLTFFTLSQPVMKSILLWISNGSENKINGVSNDI